MKQWVIKQPIFGDGTKGKVEVWQYVTDVEEAMKYPYVYYAILKYGADKTLPVAINDYGGYHPLKPDSPEILRIVNSEEKPELKLEDKYYMNLPNFNCGWVGPDCNTYACFWMEHLNVAADIAKTYYGYDDVRPDDCLLEHGWIKVTDEKLWFGRWNKINDEQIKLMDRLNIKHLVNTEYSCEELIDHADTIRKFHTD